MSETLRQDIALSRIRSRRGYVSATVVFEIPSNVSRLLVQVPPGTTVEETSGFSRRGPLQFVWTGGRPTPALELTVTAGTSPLVAGGKTMADTGEWAIIEAPNLLTQWNHRGRQPTFERRILIDDEGVGSSDGGLVYLGPHREHTRRAAGQTIRLIEPEAATLWEAPDDILDSLAYAARELKAGGRDDEVVGIAAPTRPVNWGPGGLHAGGNAFWAKDTSRLATPNNTWVHEYIHTRQEFGTAASMKWIVEATAVYYATHLTHRQGLISDAACHSHLNTAMCKGDVLGSPMSWSSAYVPYRKGSRLASWLDRQLRETGGVTLADVLRSMNHLSDGSINDPAMVAGLGGGSDAIDFETFKRILADELGTQVGSRTFQPIAGGLDSGVRGRDVPPQTPPPTVEAVPTDPTPVHEPPPEPGVEEDDTDEPFGERHGEEIIEGDGRIDEGTVFGDDEDDEPFDETDISDIFDEAGTTTVRIETSGSDVTVGGDVDEADIERTETGISVSTFGSEVEVDTSSGISVSSSGGADVSISVDGVSVSGGGTDVSISTTGGIDVDGDVSVDSMTGGQGDGACSFCGNDLSGYDGSQCPSCGWPTRW